MKALRTRLIASILMLVLVTVVGRWLAMGAALRPLLRQVFTSDLRMAVTVVERLEQGADRKELERRWGVRIRKAPWYNGDLHPSPPECSRQAPLRTTSCTPPRAAIWSS